jgi:hypothetical protein
MLHTMQVRKEDSVQARIRKSEEMPSVESSESLRIDSTDWGTLIGTMHELVEAVEEAWGVDQALRHLSCALACCWRGRRRRLRLAMARS